MTNEQENADLLEIWWWLKCIGGSFEFQGIDLDHSNMGHVYLVVDDDCNEIAFSDFSSKDWIHDAAEWVRKQRKEGDTNDNA